MLFSSFVIGSALMFSNNVIAADDNVANTTAVENAKVNVKANTNNNVENNSTRTQINFLGLGDPTRPPNAVVVKNDDAGNVVSTGPVLQGIFHKHNGKMAVINFKNYFVGNQINLSGEDLKIGKITDNSVVLTGGSAGEIVLSLTPNVNKENVVSKVGKTKKSNK